jgi:hypothetical protein
MRDFLAKPGDFFGWSHALDLFVNLFLRGPLEADTVELLSRRHK